MGDDDVGILIMPEKRRRCQVVEAGEIRAAKPFNRQSGKLRQRPVMRRVAAPELVYVKIRSQRIHVYVEALRQKVLALLGIVLRLPAVVEYLRRAYAHAIGGIGHLVDDGVCIVNVAALVRVGAAHKNKILLVLYGAVEDLPTVAKSLPEECLLVVARRGYAYDQFICIRLHRLFKEVVLFGLFVGVHLVAYGDIAVE